jgi:hypothetical protein
VSTLDEALLDGVLAAVTAGSTVEDYLYAIRRGALPCEVDHAVAEGLDVYFYGACRETGASHADLIEYARASRGPGATARVDLLSYFRGRLTGSTHRELVDAANGESDLSSHIAFCTYIWLRQQGFSHAEVQEVAKAPTNEIIAAEADRNEVTYGELLAAEYEYWRLPLGNSHEGFIEALSSEYSSGLGESWRAVPGGSPAVSPTGQMPF